MADGDDKKGCSPQVMAAMITAAGAITVAVITTQSKAPAPQPAPTVSPDPIATPAPFVASPAPSPAPSPSPTDAAAGRQLLVRNRCNLPVNLWIVYEGPNGLEFSGYGMWTYAPGESSFAAFNSRNIRPINDSILFYAETTDGTVNWVGDRNMDFNGRILAMRKADIATDAEGNYVMELNCSSS
ncbi:hypothetical protein GON01_14915 [Sphingomonas sp. MAH-20]|uniref:DUF1036 domain-containing protein n=1 Tax=Sphingomonas horti TaxID=2682842 RepID=A0A6I4J3C2_9SPHN|nr:MULTISPECIES: hypothetical protein [Sphingomonas]MBA2919189.1 hypothetical protein [Sphingomonas sp. CGMCC 1.13658]MVO79222.1 hypothetical protein [Sphingomonas horti]